MYFVEVQYTLEGRFCFERKELKDFLEAEKQFDKWKEEYKENGIAVKICGFNGSLMKADYFEELENTESIKVK